MGTERATALITQADEFARRLRQWNQRRITRQVAELVEQQLVIEKQTINVRVVKEAEVKATVLLKSNQQWVQTQQRRLQLKHQNDERCRKWLSWLLGVVGRCANTWVFFILWALSAGALGWVGGLNTPRAVVCQTQESPCYQLRIWGVKRAIADMPKPQCTKSSKGLMCLLPHQK